MQIPSARPSETINEEFTVSNRYTLAQVILAVLFPIIFFLLFLGALNIGLLDGFPDEFKSVAHMVFIGIGLIIGLYLTVGALYTRLTHHYFVTNERIVQVIGWLSQSSISVDFASVTDMTVNQDVFERFLINSGTLNIDTAGGPGEEIMLNHIASPYKLRDEIFKYMEEQGNQKKLIEKKIPTSPTTTPKSVNPPTAPMA